MVMAVIVSRVSGVASGGRTDVESKSRDTDALPKDYRSWRRQAFSHRNAMLSSLTLLARKNGAAPTRTLRALVGRYLASKDAQLLALRRAMSRGRDAQDRGWEREFYKRWRQYRQGRDIDELNPMKPSNERRRTWLQQKNRLGGGDRRLWKFGPCMTSRQLLVAEAMGAIAKRRLWSQTLFDGGRVAAVQQIKEALRDPACTHFAYVDVAGFFDNVDLRGATHLLPIDGKVMENTLCVNSTSSNVEHGNRYMRDSVCDDVAVCRPLALPQGAASSPLIAYWLLEQAFPARDVEHSFPYADDLLMLGESEEDVAAKVSRYESNLVGHPAGPLQLRVLERGETMGGFEFLGVMFYVEEGEDMPRVVRTEVTMENGRAFREKVQRTVSHDARTGDRFLSKTCEYLTGFLASMPTDDHECLVRFACDAAKAAGVQASPLLGAGARFLTGAAFERVRATSAG
jgi:hypothetical protein